MFAVPPILTRRLAGPTPGAASGRLRAGADGRERCGRPLPWRAVGHMGQSVGSRSARALARRGVHGVVALNGQTFTLWGIVGHTPRA